MDAFPLRCNRVAFRRAWIGVLATTSGALSFTTLAIAANINGQVLGAGAPIANSTVTLSAASAGAPKQLARPNRHRRPLRAQCARAAGKDASLYLVAKGGRSAADKSGGDNPAIALTDGGRQQSRRPRSRSTR